MRAQSPWRRIQRWKGWVYLLFVFVFSLLSCGDTHAQQGEGLSRLLQPEDKVVTIERFLLRLGPKQSDFSLQKKVTVLWAIENLVREYFESLYEGSSDTIFWGAGITGLSIVPPEEESPAYETVKFLGGAVTFDAESLVTPTQSQLQVYIEEALDPDLVIQRLGVYFPTLESAVFVPLALGNRGFGNDLTAPVHEEEDSDGNQEHYQKPLPKPLAEELEVDTVEDYAGNSQEQVYLDTTNSDLHTSGIQASVASYDDGGASKKTMVGLSTGVALGGVVILLLIALLVQSRHRRMEFWRESRDDKNGSLSLQDDIAKKPNSGIATNTEKYYMEEEQEPSLRLPRIWGVTPSGRMDAVTTPGSSDFSSSNAGDSIQEILTCTGMDRRSIQNVESFEHQKRLVDTLKKEMMASNAEIHPYMQDTHLDHTEPCALSPTDLSAAALENDASSRPVPTWHAPSDSSFTGSGSGSGYDSPTSPLRVMMRTLQMSAARQQTQSNCRRNNVPHEPDCVEL